MIEEPELGSMPIDEEPAALLLQVWDDGEAEVVRRLLETYGIPCQVVSSISHRVFPLSVDGLGEIRILVPSDRLHDAEAIVAEHRRQGLEVLRDEDEAGS
jgi:hypothetical protein